ncbi:MAG: sugar phosphate isomerase/epimerase [Alphaproteobacteria bacterium]
MRLHVGLNPYGLTYHLGLQGHGTPRANPDGRGLRGFIAIARELKAEVLEIFEPWLTALTDDELRALRDELAGLGIRPIVSSGLTMGSVEHAFRAARLLDATLMRFALSRVLCGDRNAQGDKWPAIVADVRAGLARWAPVAADAGITLAIENHQDFTSAELVAFCAEAGPSVGLCFDMGNTFPVAEAPIDFTRAVAPWVRYCHLKDYRVQFTDQGFRLIRCAIGDGAVPYGEMVAILGAHHDELPAALEPGALEARHVRLFTADWWNGYPAKDARALAACLAAARHNRLPEDADYRTPWERGEDSALVDYELAMIRRSAANMRALGLMPMENAA